MKILLFLGLFLITSYAISVTTCQNITTSGTYILENDLIGANITPIPLRTNGCIVIYSNDVVLDGNGFSIVNNATDDAVGIEINASNVEIKNFKNISAYAFAIFGVNGENNSIHNSTILFNQVGSAFYQMNNTNIYNNSIINIIDEGIAIGYSHNFSIYDNYFFNMTKAINATSLGNNTYIHNNQFNYTGYAVAIQNSYSNISYNNIFNSTYGIGVFGDNTLSLRNTIISYNNISAIIQYGIQLNTAQNSTVSFNDVSDSFAGILSTTDLTGPTLIGNIVHGNSFGDTIELSNLSSISYEHYFNNDQDLQLQMSSSDVPVIFNATGIVFDNPSGNFQNFTNISINDVIDPHSRYFFNWSSQPAALNLGDTSFNNKYLNFSSENETKLIDEVIWYWSTAEESGYTPADLRLKFYNGTWQNLSSLPDTMARTLTITNLNISGVYGIFESTTPNCPIISSSGLYTMNNNFTGAPNDISEIQAGATACVKFAASDIDFDCNGYSLSESGAAGLNWAFASNTTGYNNITIRNCRIQNYDVSINLQATNYSLIYNNSILDSTFTPISVNSGNFVNISTNNITNTVTTSNQGILIFSGANNSISSNYLSNTYGGIYLNLGSNYLINNNQILASAHEAIRVLSSSDILVDSNSITGFTAYGIQIDANTRTNITNNNVSNGVVTGSGIGITGGSTSTLVSLNHASGATNGYYVSGADGVTFTNNTATSNSLGFYINSLNNLLQYNHVENGMQIAGFGFTGNKVYSNEFSNPTINDRLLYLYLSTENDVQNNTFQTSGIATNQLVLADSSNRNNFVNNVFNGTNAQQGITSVDNFGISPSGWNITNNTFYGVSDTCIYLYHLSSSTIDNNTIYSCTNAGIFMQGDTGNTINRNILYSNTYGIQSLYSEITLISNNTIFNNNFGISQDMSFIGTSTPGNFIGYNNISNSSVQGIQLLHTINTNLYNNQIFNNTVGEFISGRSINDNVTLNNEHFYGNSQDLNFQTLSANHLIINATNLVFDNPLGNNQNFSNISLNHTLVPIGFSAAYGITWAVAPAISLPANVTSFNQKFINITATSGNPVIDTIQWQWSPTETMGYNETNLTIYNLNSTWIKKGGSLSVGSHTLTLNNLNLGNLVYAIVDDEIPIPPVTNLVYFVSPTPTNNTNITTTPIVIALNHINGTLSSPCLVQLNGVNQTGTIAGDACSYSFTPTINNTNYTVIGYMNLTGTMVASNETRYFTWFSTPAPQPPQGGGGNTGNPVGTGYLNLKQNTTNDTIPYIPPASPQVQQYDYKCILLGILLLGLWFWARRKE